MLPASRTLEDTRLRAVAPGAASRPVFIVLGAVLLCVGLAVLAYGSGRMVLFRYAFPALALALGLVLYRVFPVLYVGYTWWLWFLTPFVRRVVDYQAGWQDPSLIMLAPYLVSGLALLTVLRHRARLLDRTLFPFTLVLVAILYGYAIGVLRQGPAAATNALLQWMVPVLFALHVAMCWRQYPALRRCVLRAFSWGVVVMGIYAVLQFYLLPPWDSFWMVESQMGSIGRPLPLAVRVFGTMNAPAAFSTAMMAGLLLLFALPIRKHLLAAVPGYVAFLLSLVRSAWGGWILGIGLMAVWIKGRMRRRLVGVLLLGTLVVVPLLTVPEIAQRLGDRFSSFEDFQEDVSLNARLALYRNATLRALTDPVGLGIGSTGTAQKMKTGQAWNFDSGLLIIPYELGWPGALLYVGGLILLMLLLYRGQRRTGDAFAAISTSIGVASLALLLFKNTLTGSLGIVLWCFLGLSVTSYLYHDAREAEDAEDGFSA